MKFESEKSEAKKPQKISKGIDWLSVTFPCDISPMDVFPTLRWVRTGDGRFWSDRWQESQHGLLAQVNPVTKETGNQLQLSGGALASLRLEWGATDFELLKHVSDHNGRLSRIDLAIDIRNGKLTPMHFYRAAKRKVIKSTAKAFDYIRGHEDGIDGMTFYLGKRASERYVRCYDKAAEMHIVDGEAHLRLEMELKGLRAKMTQGAALQHGVSAVTNAQFNDFMQWSHPEFKDAVSGLGCELDAAPRKQTNTERWLMETVVGSLAKACVLDPSFRRQFDDAVSDEIDRQLRLQTI